MRTWIDNTGLHGAGRALTRRSGTPAEDAKALLQLATLIVFSETMTLGGFEHRLTAEASADYRYRLVQVGVPDNVLMIRDTTRAEYEAECRLTARSAALEIPNSLQRNEYEELGLRRPELPRGTTFDPQLVPALATGNFQHEQLREIHSTAFDGEERADNAVAFMLASSTELRRALADLIVQWPGWSAADSWHVEAFLRSKLNERLSGLSDATYAPAVSRAQLLARQRIAAFRQLESEVDLVASELRAEPLGLPSIYSALLERSKGRPRGIIDAALELRLKATPVRGVLESFATAMKRDSIEDRAMLRKKIKEIGRHLRASLGVTEAPSLLGALDIQTLINIPFGGAVGVPLTPSRLASWFKQQLAGGRFAALTEIAMLAAFTESSAIYLETLTHEAGSLVGQL
jgi:hypothetical protein